MSYTDVKHTVNDAINELESTISEFKDDAEAMIAYADQKRSHVVNNSERYVPLDDTPFGEELIRTQDIPEQLNNMLEELAELNEEKPNEQLEVLKLHEEILESLQAEFDDCYSNDDVEHAKKETEDEW